MMKSFYFFKGEQPPVAHVLMPVYNVEDYIIASVQSVLTQSWPYIKLIIYNDGSTDKSMGLLRAFLEKAPFTKRKVDIIDCPLNKGVSIARNELVKFSKKISPSAYLFWLDADDKYIEKNFIKKALRKMIMTRADICLIDFSIKFEKDDEVQRRNAIGLIAEKEKTSKILQSISEAENNTVAPLGLANVLDVTSLGWIKCYAPWFEMPIAEPCSFEDLSYMSALLRAKKITALSAGYYPLEYLRRSSSICGQRRAEHFTHDIPRQLEFFFDTVLQDLQQETNTTTAKKKLSLAQNYVIRKVRQYYDVLDGVIKQKSHPYLDDAVMKIYSEKTQQLKLKMDAALMFINRISEDRPMLRCAL